MRAWAEKAYGIPPEQVVGSSGVVKFEIGADGKPELMKLAKVEFVDDGPGKPAGINRFIGRRPIFAFGNSDGDLQMLQWTVAGPGARFAGIVHHTDAEREYAYDRQSKIGKLDKAWDEAKAKGWTVVDMKQDWKTIFPRRKAVRHGVETDDDCGACCSDRCRLDLACSAQPANAQTPCPTHRPDASAPGSRSRQSGACRSSTMT